MSNFYDGLGYLKNEILKNQIKSDLKEESTNRRLDYSSNLTGEQKFLILYYLGFCNEIRKNTQKASLFTLLIEELSYDTTRTMFSRITEYEDEKNLNVIINLFQSLKLDVKARELEAKLKKLNKR